MAIDPKMLRGALNVGAFQSFDSEFTFPGNASKLLPKLLRKAAFEPIDPKSDDNRAAGFVEFERPDSTDFSVGSLFFPPRFCLFAWRVDTLKVPPAAIRKAMLAWVTSFEEKNGRQPGRRERAEQKELVRRLLRAKQEPSTKVFPVAVEEETGALYVFAASSGILDEVNAVFGALLEAEYCQPAAHRLASIREAVAEAGGDLPPGPLEIGSLARAFLTWLLWRSESTAPVTTSMRTGHDVNAVFFGKTELSAIGTDVSTARVTGLTAPYSQVMKQLMRRGLFVDSACVRFTAGPEEHYAVTLDAQTFTMRGLKLPAVLTEEVSDQLTERLDMVADVVAMVDDLVKQFARLRLSPEWQATADSMLAWIHDDTASAKAA